MAEEKVATREATWRDLLPWTSLFRGFEVTLDLNKLLLAAAGIVVMWLGWVLLSLIFGSLEKRNPPGWPENWKSHAQLEDEKDPDKALNKAWILFRKERQHWNLMHEAAGLDRRDAPPFRYEVLDLAETLEEYNLLTDNDRDVPKTAAECLKKIQASEKAGKIKPEEAQQWRAKYALVGRLKPAGRLSISPWSEDRGPNPYLLLTGQAGIPWEAGRFTDWFIRDQLPVMIEPLIKFVRPIIYFLSPRNDFTSRIYFLLVTLWTLVTWSFFGGAITRIAVVQLTGHDPVGLFDSLRFAIKRFLYYITAPLFPLAIVFLMLVLLLIFGLLHMIPWFGDIFVDGLFWWLALLAGLVMAVSLVGLVSWPLMAATVSTEGADGWEAFTRAYNYILNRPWQCLWYALVAVAYGGIIVFFVGFMSSLAVYMAKWGVSQTPSLLATSRDPSYLFVYAPTSFGWRELLLEGAVVETTGKELVPTSAGGRPAGISSVGGVNRYDRIDPDAYAAYVESLHWWNKLGAALVAFWLILVFLGVIGFGYAYFWSASTIIYLLLRRSIDTYEMDEVYFEEDDSDSFRGPTTPPVSPTPAAPATPARPVSSLPIVEARPASAPPPASVAPTATPVVTPAAPVVPPPMPPEAKIVPPEPKPAPEPKPVVETKPLPLEKPADAIVPPPTSTSESPAEDEGKK